MNDDKKKEINTNVSRTQNTIKNMVYSWINSIITMILSFISRTIFIKVLGTTYLGLNGLFTNIISVLSFTELGIGTAMNFALYKPVAENDEQKIKLLMKLYKNTYRIIALIISILGLLIMPALSYLAKDVGNVGNIYEYYLIFLVDTVISYFVSYKFSLLNANQKNYIYTNIDMIFKIIVSIIQMISILIYKNFGIYLLTGVIIGAIEKIVLNFYLNKKYSYLTEKVDGKLSEEELKPIKKNISALIYHKLGDIAVHQTDNIIVSSFINVNTAGLISNYTLIINYINIFVGQIFNSATASLGNLIATEKTERQYDVFKKYNFLNFWLYGFCTISLLTLLSAFISIVWGMDKIIDDITVIMMCIDFYMIGQRLAINNIKVAGGIFKEDKLVSIFQAITNLIISIIFVNIIGLPGVYLGTIISGIIATVIRPKIIYRKLFKISSKEYFKKYLEYFFIVFVVGVLMYLAMKVVLKEPNIFKFIIMVILDIIIPNLIFFAIFNKTEEFKYIKKIAISIINEKVINKVIKKKTVNNNI